MKYYLAIDLGATSGRHVVGYFDNGKITLDEVYRFKTGMDESNDGLVWDIPRLNKEIIRGIKESFKIYPNIVSLSIDTWGVDYVLMNNDKEIPPYYAYRNERNIEASKKVHALIPFNELYKLTGIQSANFNTIYQLFDDKEKGRLETATDYLMLPSYFTYKLTGVKTHEYTNESTGALLNANTKEYLTEVINKLGLPNKIFKSLDYPGLKVGRLLPDIAKEVGGNLDVILCASHDTASAFESIEVDEDTIILSSGTWSLLGIKSNKPIINEQSLRANYTNEGGVNYIRFLKNIMGMYIANRIIEENNLTQDKVNKEVIKSNYDETFDVNNSSLSSPNNMSEAVRKLLKDNPPKDVFDLLRSVYQSMAKAYKTAISELEEIVGRKFNKIAIIGGGAKNEFLNKLVNKYTNKQVIPMPIEATCLGNIKIQMKARGINYEKRS